MQKMTLARTLRYKKRVIEQIRSLETDIQSSNSIINGAEREVDILACLEARKVLVSHLVDVKLLIQNATRPVQRLILELAEAKSEIALLQKIDVRHGLIPDQWGDTTATTRDAIIRKAKRDEIVESLQNKIDELQSKIDIHNADTLVEVNDLILPKFQVLN